MTASLSELPFVDYQYPTKDPAGGRIAIIGEAPAPRKRGPASLSSGSAAACWTRT